MNLIFEQLQSTTDKHGNPVGWITIHGPLGTVTAYDIGWITDGYYTTYPDRLHDLYLTIWATTQGHYHCCLTGRVWLRN